MSEDPSIFLFERLLKNLRERRASYEETLAYGAVPDFTAFRELRAHISELGTVEQELRTLLRRITDDPEDS
jgi:hypothetical protein